MATEGSFDPDRPWYHGSPLELTELRPGSTITQDRQLARIFSHKPTLVSLNDDGGVRHNGGEEGYLYGIRETVRREDIEPHSTSVMPPSAEWLTRRALTLALVERTRVCPEERLCRGEVVLLHLRVALRGLCVWFNMKWAG